MRPFQILLLLASLILIPVQLSAQHYVPRAERGDPNERLKTNIDANNVRTTLFNFGFTGRTGVALGEVPYEWPKGTRQNYCALSAIFVGGEVRNDLDSLIHIVDVPNYRQGPGGASWNFEPVPGYRNRNNPSIARSDDPTTWPDRWPDKMNDTTDAGWHGSWNGLLGKNARIEGVEMYMHFSDDRYNRFVYTPDSTDNTRKGLGIVDSRRVLEFTNPMLSDAVLFVDDIYNAGTKDIEKTSLCYWVADLLGGDGDSQDDHLYYSRDTSTIWSQDNDGRGDAAFGNMNVGVSALVLLAAPNGPKFTRIQYTAAGGINFNTKSDAAFWVEYLKPSSDSLEWYDSKIRLVGDYDAFASAGLFPIAAGGSQRLISAMVLAPDTAALFSKIEYLKTFVRNNFTISPISIVAESPVADSTVSGNLAIKWNADAGNVNTSIDIFATSDMGSHWEIIGRNLPNTGTFLWNSAGFPDGILNRFQIVAHDSLRLGFAFSDGYFRINNDTAAQPQLRLLPLAPNSVFADSMTIAYYAGDADSSGVQLTLLSSVDNFRHTDSLFSGKAPNGAGEYHWNISGLPNSNTYRLKGIVRKDTLICFDSTVAFAVRNTRYTVSSDTTFLRRTTRGTGTIEVHVVDTTQLNGHAYKVAFTQSGNDTVYHVVDETKGDTTLAAIRDLIGFKESPLFNGMRLYVRNDTIPLGAKFSNWSRDSVRELVMDIFRMITMRGIPDLTDYTLYFGDVGIDTSVNLQVSSSISIPAKPVNVTIVDRFTGRRVPFAFLEADGNDGRFSTGRVESDYLILMAKKPLVDSLVPTWRFMLTFDPLKSNPKAGDSIILHLKKPFLPGDMYTFKAMTPSGYIMGAGDQSSPVKYVLEQNYPNPFNPQTTISFSLAKREFVQLEVYNIIGQRVRTLLSSQLEAGGHTLHWDGKDGSGRAVSSGVYLYRLAAGSFRETKKMMLLR